MDTVDPRTMAAYDRFTEEYTEVVLACIEMRHAQKAVFLDHLPDGPETVLDWGCGQADMSALMIAHGLAVEAVDANPSMAAAASQLGVQVLTEPFEALAPAPRRYRGIWAHVSLCHASREDVPELIALGAGTLLRGGIFHICMKHGRGEGRDRFDRFFSYWDLEELADMVESSGMDVIMTELAHAPGMGSDSESYCTIVGRTHHG